MHAQRPPRPLRGRLPAVQVKAVALSLVFVAAAASAASAAVPRATNRTMCRGNQHMVAHTHRQVKTPMPMSHPGAQVRKHLHRRPPKPQVTYSGQRYIVRDAYWLGEQQQCISNRNATTNFTVTQKAGWDPNGRVVAFPDIYRGCMWSVCSPRAGLPRQVGSLGSPRLTLRTKEGVFGMYNAAFDVRVLKENRPGGEADGAELMVWLNEHGGCCGLQRGAPKVKIDGTRWWFSHWRTCTHLPWETHVCWNYVQFRRVHRTWQVSGLRLRPFIRRAEAAGLIKPRWWLQTIEAGFEIWTGGRGLAVTKFRAASIGRR